MEVQEIEKLVNDTGMMLFTKQDVVRLITEALVIEADKKLKIWK